MPALTTSSRFFNAGITSVIYVPVIADPDLEATRAELTAGTILDGEINSLSGWTVTGGEIETPDLATTFTSKIPGKTSVDDSSITFYASQDGDDVRAVLPRGTAGYIVIMDGGDVPTQPMDVFPVRVRSVGKVRTVDESAAVLTVSFSIVREPVEDVVIPAAV